MERLTVISGPNKGHQVDIIGAITVGRSAENGLQISDLQVSRKHASIQQTPSGTILRDLNSGNGTFVDKRRIIEYKLSPDDIIAIGPVEIKYEVLHDAQVGLTPPQTLKNIVFEDEAESTVQSSPAASVYQTLLNAPAAEPTQNKDDSLRSAQARLAAIYEATQIISSERDVGKVLDCVMDRLFGLIPAHNGVILLRDEHTGELVEQHVRSGTPQKKVTISRSIVRRAFEHREAVLTQDASVDDRFGAGMSIIAQNITSAMCAPLEHQEEVLGVLYADTRGTMNAFTQNDLQLTVALCRAAGIAIKNAQYLARLESAYKDTLIVLSNAIELRDHYTVGHTWRVTHFAVEIGKKLGWDEEKLEECRIGGILHDVGKIAVDDAILRKPSKLTEEEYAKMQVHPERGARLMQDSGYLVPLIPYALYHHERWDGNGYPFQLAGENIPIEGRAVAVADTFDAMTSNRPYRRGIEPELAIERIIEVRGTQLDPKCVDALVTSYHDGSIRQVMQNFYEKDGRSIACPFCSTFIRIPDHVHQGSEIHCSVCHRRIRVQYQNDAFYGELIAEQDTTPLPPSAHG